MNHNFNEEMFLSGWEIEPLNLYSPIHYALQSGGKRTRPLLVELAFDLFKKEEKNIFDAAAAIEIFHNFTLLHDDIMDNSPLRRNRPAVHKKWNVNTAILSGDAMMLKSYQFLQKIPEKYWAKVFPLFTQTALQVCEGQQLDIDFETQENISLDDYFLMIKLKTAVLLACSLKIGAILADAPEKDADLLYDFGVALGIAFQIKDDYLDVFGDEQTLGKRIGSDILCNKKTFLLISARQNADSKTLENLNFFLKCNQITDTKKIIFVTDIFRKLNIDKICETEINKFYLSAIDFLNKISADEAKKSNLKIFAEKLNLRTN
jgi:geranylgeranyl diphosphate synthase type II